MTRTRQVGYPRNTISSTNNPRAANSRRRECRRIPPLIQSRQQRVANNIRYLHSPTVLRSRISCCLRLLQPTQSPQSLARIPQSRRLRIPPRRRLRHAHPPQTPLSRLCPSQPQKSRRLPASRLQRLQPPRRHRTRNRRPQNAAKSFYYAFGSETDARGNDSGASGSDG